MLKKFEKKINPKFFAYIVMCIFLITTNLYASVTTKSTHTSVGNVLTRPLNIVLHKNGSIAYVSAPTCRCILMIDFSKPSPIISLDDQINVSGFRDIGPIAINYAQDELYVIDNYQSFYVVDTQTNTIDSTPITVNKYPNSIFVSKDGQTIFVCAKYAVTMIHAETKSIEGTIALEGIDPYGVTFANHKLYVAEENNDTVYVIDPVTQSIRNTISVNDYSYYLIASPDESSLYVSHCIDEGLISVIDTATDTVKTTISLNGNGKCPQGMTIVDSTLFVANSGDGTISRINMMSNLEIICQSSLLSGDQRPEYLVSSANGKQLYVVHPDDERIMIVDIPSTCPTIKKDLGHSVFSDEREKSIFILETDICENQPLTFTVSTDKPELFSMNPTISTSGEMHYQPNIKNSGKAQVNISIIDPSGYCSSSESFYITIIATGYKLSLEKKGRGEIQIDDGDENLTTLTPWESLYLANTPITLTAIAQKNYVFAGWSNGLISLKNPIGIILTKDLVLKANFLDVSAYAIIIQGKRSDNEGLPAHEKTCDLVWQTFIKNGVDVKYLKYDNNSKIDQPSVDAVEYAITQWAFEKMTGKGSSLTIVFIGHGSEDMIYIDGEKIHSSVLNSWITHLQNQLKEKLQHNKIITVIGACHSGSFVDDLSGENRIVITSSSPEEMAFKGPLIDNGIRQGDFFVAEFIKNIGRGESIKDSFMAASLLTERFTYSMSNTFISSYNDKSFQHPLLDDNHDQHGSNDLHYILSDEGIIAQSQWIGNSLRKRSMPYTSDHFVRETRILDEMSDTTSFTLMVSDAQNYSQFWIDIKPPDFSIEDHPQATDQLEMNHNYRHKRTLFEDVSLIEWTNIQEFSASGEYQVLFFGLDKVSSEISLLKEVNVFKNKEENDPPAAFSIISPQNNETILPVFYPASDQNKQYVCVLEWEKAIDPNNDRVYYTVWISPSSYFVNPIVISNLLMNQAIISLYDDAPSDNSDPNRLIIDMPCYWKVQAFDQYGAYSEETNPYKFIAKNPNGTTGCLQAVFQDVLNQNLSLTGHLIKKNLNAEFSISLINGLFFILGGNGNFSVFSEVDGYKNAETEIQIPEGCPTHPPKQIIELYRQFDLSDIIYALQSLIDSQRDIMKRWEVNNDEKISLLDIIFMMNQLGH
jgi:YVTN family beta-propeller protein